MTLVYFIKKYRDAKSDISKCNENLDSTKKECDIPKKCEPTTISNSGNSNNSASNSNSNCNIDTKTVCKDVCKEKIKKVIPGAVGIIAQVLYDEKNNLSYLKDGDIILLQADNGNYLSSCNDLVPCMSSNKLKDGNSMNMVYCYADSNYVNNNAVNSSAKWKVRFNGRKIRLQNVLTGNYLSLCNNCITDDTVYANGISYNQTVYLTSLNPRNPYNTLVDWTVIELNDNKIMLAATGATETNTKTNDSYDDGANKVYYLNRCEGCYNQGNY